MAPFEVVPCVLLLELGENALRVDIARPLQNAPEVLMLGLPLLQVRSPRGRPDQVGGAEALVGVQHLDDVQRLRHHLLAKGPNGRDLLAHQAGRRVGIVVHEEADVVLDVLHAQREAHADAERAMVVHVEHRQRLHDHLRWLYQARRRVRDGRDERQRRRGDDEREFGHGGTAASGDAFGKVPESTAWRRPVAKFSRVRG
mmetsp:Transcript_11257/g.42012  ORF Transcript_11257/g.42012 Transcript_11257/m.42012 type:complete len:200 (-) Transcript_11257:12-611(-)